MMKGMFKITARTIIGIVIGVLLFTLLFMFVNIPSPIPEASFKTAYGLGAFLATFLGPIAGALIQSVGHVLADVVQFGSPWWSRVVASGVAGFIFGFAFKRVKVEMGEFKIKDLLKFNLIQVVGNLLAWAVIAPVLDILFYPVSAENVFKLGINNAIINIISVGVIGSLLFVFLIRPQKKNVLKTVVPIGLLVIFALLGFFLGPYIIYGERTNYLLLSCSDSIDYDWCTDVALIRLAFSVLFGLIGGAIGMIITKKS